MNSPEKKLRIPPRNVPLTPDSLHKLSNFRQLRLLLDGAELFFSPGSCTFFRNAREYDEKRPNVQRLTVIYLCSHSLTPAILDVGMQVIILDGRGKVDGSGRRTV